MRVLTVLFLGLCLAGCEAVMSEAVDRMADEESRALIDTATDAVLAGDIDPLLPLLDPRISPDAARVGLQQMLDYLPEGEPDERDLAGFHWNDTVRTDAGGTVRTRVRNAVVLLRYGEDRYGLQFNLYAENDNPMRIANLRAVFYDPALYGPPAELTTAHQVFRAAAIGIPVFVLLTLVAMFRLKRVKRRILWTLFIIIVCYPVFQMNWSTGEWAMTAPGMQTSANGVNISFLEFTFFGGAAVRSSVVEPWIISAAVPLGAIFFWLKLMTVGIRRKPPKPGRCAVETPGGTEAQPPIPSA